VDLKEYPPIMDSSHVAEMLGMSVSHLRHLVRTGQIPAHRMPGGRAIKFYRDELEEWLKDLPTAAINYDSKPEPTKRRVRR
jgi:excisionase family DNA binding protein